MLFCPLTAKWWIPTALELGAAPRQTIDANRSGVVPLPTATLPAVAEDRQELVVEASFLSPKMNSVVENEDVESNCNNVAQKKFATVL